MKRALVVLTGLTGSGKTDLAISLARKINGKIITVDSTQLIKQISVLNNKANPENGVDLLGHIDGFEYFSVVDYSKALYNAVEKTARIQIPILEGGSIYYIKMILDGKLVI